MKAAILGIGTELTSGQILNGNAQWISARLKEFGIVTTLHVVVPDDKALILQALKSCHEHAELIFVTGGLGPTSDDITREVIAQFCQRDLVYDESSWQHLSDRLSSRGVPVRERQRQQCYFPQGSEVLVNRNGTANGFALASKDKSYFVLPGPPRELQGIWADHLQAKFNLMSKNLDPYLTQSWDCLGLGEGELAHLLEDVVKACPFEIAYRVHMPYVEIKISYFRSQEPQAQNYVLGIDEKLKFHCVARDGQDLAQIFCQKISARSCLIIDEATEGFLLQRLMPFAQNLLRENKLNYVSQKIDFSNFEFVFKLKKQNEGCWVECIEKNQNRKIFISVPYQNLVLMQERVNQYFSEQALLFAKQVLS